MDCRTHERRTEIVNQYDVRPVAHIQLLAGQTKRSDAGATIENDYYIFEVRHRDSDQIEYIQCGMGAARDFLRLLQHEGLPLFNPLHQPAAAGGNAGAGTNEQHGAVQWNPAAKQLYNAVMWLIMAWDASPGTPLFDFLQEAEQYKYCEPFLSRVKKVNTAIRHGGRGRTLTQIIETFRANNMIRDELCRFELLTRILEENEGKEPIESYF